MLIKEREFYSPLVHAIVGIDEAGRGPLAGPVFAAAVLFDPSYQNEEINDSKKLTEKRREELFLEIKKNAIAYGIASVSADEIDEMNIYEATKKCMLAALSKVQVPYDMIITDAMKLKTEKQPNDTKENIVDKKENINETKENIVNHTDNDIDKNDNNIEVKKENIENTETNLIKDKGIKQSTTEENNILESKDNEIKNDTKVVEKTVTKEANNLHKKVINDKKKYSLSDHKKSYKKQIISRQPQIDQKNEIKTNTTVTITNSTINKIDNKTSIISPFDLSCLFFKQPKAMKEELGKIINSQKLKIKNDKVKLNFL